MKILCLTSIALICCSLSTYATDGEVLVLEGKYQLRNIYVQNSFSATGVGFCAFEVKVNGDKTSDEVNSSAFEIDLSRYQFKQGDKVLVEIKHKEKCLPRIINPEALKPIATFEIISINIANDGVLNWSTKKENGSLTFYVEQFRWNKWVKIGEVQGVGLPDVQSYSFKTDPHSGVNKFRVKQTGFGQPKYSEAVSYNSSIPPITMMVPEKNNNEIIFSKETKYEVYDMYGVVVKTGFGDKVDVSNLSKGKYYVSYDNNNAVYEKKAK